MKNSSSLVFVASFFILTACASQPKPSSLAVLPDQGPVALEIKPEVGASDRTLYRARSVARNFTDGELARKYSVGVDFTVDTKVTAVDPKTRASTVIVTTVEKDGKVDLSDFAMPEVGDSLEYVFTPHGEVLKAGDMPKGTLYFVPPVPLPKGEVKVGDNWNFQADWVNTKSGLPLRLQLLVTLKSLRDCGAAGPCAELDLSGDYSIVGLTQNTLNTPVIENKELLMRYRTDVRGRQILSLKKGSVLYSLMRSDESMNNDKNSVQVSSCTLTYVIEPVADKILKDDAKACDPAGELPAL